MLQANCNRSNTNTLLDSPVDIMKRLEKLNQWQEEQKRLLNERQNMQRQMLGMEQRNMYQMLGLLHSTKSNSSVDDSAIALQAAGDDALQHDIGSGNQSPSTKEQGDFNAANDREEIDQACAFEMLDGVTKLSPMTGRKQTRESIEAREITNGGEITTFAPEPNPKPKTKQPFLKRGEGLKQRFRISPDELRLHNLPRYKFATNHPKVRNLQRQRYTPKANPSRDENRGTLSNDPIALDPQEKLFRHVLRKSEHACSSTPDEKSNNKALSDKKKSPKVRYSADTNVEKMKELPEMKENVIPTVTWAKVLDSQQIQAISVQELRVRTISEATTTAGQRAKHQHEHQHHTADESEENLTIFELLERQADEGNIDMNSSCIRRLMKRKKKSASMDTSFDSASIPDTSLKQKPLRPQIDDLFRNSSLFEEETHDGDTSTHSDEQSTCNNTLNSDCSRLEGGDQSQEHTEVNGTAASGDGGEGSSGLFNQFKDALFQALMGKGAAGDNAHNELRFALQPNSPSPQAQELQEKSSLIKQRLAELETEIGAFKENNMELLRAKRAHEQERAEFTQERTEMMDRLKDEKIQMEIYLHDERMKIEEEKRNFQQYVRMHRKAATAKDRKEIERLNREIESMRQHLKQREQAHAAAQARLRVQIRNLERDQGKLFEDIERLTKENKKLQAEKNKLERDNNTRMLQAINRNIAKLAPKLSSPPPAETSTPAKADTSQPVAKTRSASLSHRSPFTHSKSKTSSSPKKNVHKPKSKVCTAPAPPNSRNPSNTNILDNINVDTHELYSDSEYDSDTQELLPAAAAKAHHQQQQHEMHCQILQQLLAESESTHSNKTVVMPSKSTSSAAAALQRASGDRTEGGRDVEDYRREIVNEDGSRDIWYPNGNLKKISADGMHIRMLYFNKDIKETNVNAGTVKYYYSETNTWHTTYLDGLEILEFPNGQTEHRHKNGLVEVYFPDNSVKIVNPAEKNKLEEWRFADGTKLVLMRNGDRMLLLPNGQKEIHTKLNKRREYPDGTVKMVYPDGSQETRYSNGRVRLKDQHGNLISDTASS